MNDKTYKTINEVSKLLNINTHIIRYWDSKLSISKQSNTNKKKFYNNLDIKKIKKLKETLYNNGKYNYSLDLAKKILNKKINNITITSTSKKLNDSDIVDLKKIRKNLNKILDL